MYGKSRRKTGVEMEALTGVNVALLTIYDMCKAIDKRMVMTDIHLVEKKVEKAVTFILKKNKSHRYSKLKIFQENIIFGETIIIFQVFL